MSAYGEMILSRIVDEGTVEPLIKYGITTDDMPTQAEKDALSFIVKYAEQNGGKAPSYAELAQNTEVTYIPQVSDSYEYLVERLKDNAAKIIAMKKLQEEAPKIFSESSGKDFAIWLRETADRIIMRTNVLANSGKTLGELARDVREEYEKRKAGKSFKMYKTPFNALNDVIGGLYTSDVYGVIAESGRGKTYLIGIFIDSLLRQGANVLVKSFEVKAFSWLSRLISIITAKEGAIKDDSGRVLGLPNKQILSAKLEGEFEQYFFDMLDKLNDYYPGKLYLQAKGDAELTRSLDDLERELAQNPDIDVVVLDPFYGLTDVYGRNANKTAGGAAEQAASKFEQIVGKYDVVGIYSVQATVEKKQTDDDGIRELKPPTRDQVKTSKRLLDIATNLFSFDSDSTQGHAVLALEKGRNGGEGFSIQLMALLDYGVLAEFPTGEAAAAQFESVF
jgi:hypothetical protein